MEPFKKRCRIGTWHEGDRLLALVVDVEVDEHGRLSISGDTRANGGRTEVSGGQNIGDVTLVKKFAEPWSRSKAMLLREIWVRWHLNDMRAGSPAQELHLRRHPPVYSYPDTFYEAACRSLAEAGLNPDPSYTNPYTSEPYLYGTAWLREELPEDVYQNLVDLTEEGVDLVPAYHDSR